MSTPVHRKLEEEIQTLERELNYELPKELKRARALGDLSENAEFIMAKQRQQYVSARIAQLKQRLADLSLINMNNIPKDRIAFGSRVLLYDLDRDAEIEYRLAPGDGGGTRFDYRNEFRPPLGSLGSLASRALVRGLPQREADASLARLKALVEAGTK